MLRSFGRINQFTGESLMEKSRENSHKVKWIEVYCFTSLFDWRSPFLQPTAWIRPLRRATLALEVV